MIIISHTKWEYTCWSSSPWGFQCRPRLCHSGPAWGGWAGPGVSREPSPPQPEHTLPPGSRWVHPLPLVRRWLLQSPARAYRDALQGGKKQQLVNFGQHQLNESFPLKDVSIRIFELVKVPKSCCWMSLLSLPQLTFEFVFDTASSSCNISKI